MKVQVRRSIRFKRWILRASKKLAGYLTPILIGMAIMLIVIDSLGVYSSYESARDMATRAAVVAYQALEQSGNDENLGERQASAMIERNLATFKGIDFRDGEVEVTIVYEATMINMGLRTPNPPFVSHHYCKRMSLRLDSRYLCRPPHTVGDSYVIDSIPCGVPNEPLFTGFHEIFEPSIVGAGLNAFTAAEVPDGCVPPKTFQHDANLLFSDELWWVIRLLNVSYKLPSFLSPSVSLPDPVKPLGHNPAPFQSLLYFF